MRGKRLLIGLVAMGFAVPAVIFYFLGLRTAGAFATIAIPSFFGWCVAEFTANVIARPLLRSASPSAALREWDQPSGDSVSSPDPSPKA